MFLLKEYNLLNSWSYSSFYKKTNPKNVTILGLSGEERRDSSFFGTPRKTNMIKFDNAKTYSTGEVFLILLK